MEKETNKDSVQIQDVTERIKTFEDACEEYADFFFNGQEECGK